MKPFTELQYQREISKLAEQAKLLQATQQASNVKSIIAELLEYHEWLIDIKHAIRVALYSENRNQLFADKPNMTLVMDEGFDFRRAERAMLEDIFDVIQKGSLTFEL